MTKFHDVVGYNLGQTQQKPGVWVDNIAERPYFGDVLRNTRQLRNGDTVNSDISVSNTVSIMADGFATENIMAIRYVKWMGVRWIVTDVSVERPRLLLTLGGVYDGPTPASSTP